MSGRPKVQRFTRARDWKRVVFFLFAILMIISAAYLAGLLLVFCTWDERSAFGQAWGGLGIVFSGAGLLGVALALLLQSKQLSEQAESLNQAREEQQRTGEVLSRQVEALALNAAAQATLLSLNARHQGYGSERLQRSIGELEAATEEVLARVRQKDRHLSKEDG